eukprot:6500635-Heterocapsa_arctica.AAC.1
MFNHVLLQGLTGGVQRQFLKIVDALDVQLNVVVLLLRLVKVSGRTARLDVVDVVLALLHVVYVLLE